MAESDEWVTIAEAARRLGISDRHARRLAAKMSDSDRRRPTRGPQRVRLVALVQIVGVSDVSGPGPADVRHESDMESDSQASPQDLRSMIAFLQEEIVRRDAAEGELRRLLLFEQQEAGRLREQLLLSAAPSSDGSPGGQVDRSGPEADQPGERLQEAGKRRWWQVWKRKG